jgi:hypothetical protein
MAVYMMQDADGGDVKIGFTLDLAARLDQLRCITKLQNLRVIRLVEGERAAEREIHFRYRHLRQRGEWFSYVEDMLTDDLGFPDIPVPPRSPTLVIARTIGVRVPEVSYRALLAAANADHRPLSQFVRLMIDKALAAGTPQQQQAAE